MDSPSRLLLSVLITRNGQLYLDEAEFFSQWFGVWPCGEGSCVGLCIDHHSFSHCPLVFSYVELPPQLVLVGLHCICRIADDSTRRTSSTGVEVEVWQQGEPCGDRWWRTQQFFVPKVLIKKTKESSFITS